MAKEMHGNGGMPVDCGSLASRFLSVTDAEGITISGGEPFAQAKNVAALLRLIKRRRDYGIIIYTGFLYEDLANRSGDDGVRELLNLADLLIDGPYMEVLDDGKPFRGSSNQRLIQLTDRYAAFADDYYQREGRRIEINIAAGRSMLVGVPSKAGLSAWKEIQNSGGNFDRGKR
jgi:anaerobic ribonucleoside-triphosphate reductase activating protein